MNSLPIRTAVLTLAAWLLPASAILVADEPPVPRFTAVTLDAHIQIGYGLAIADVDGDGHPDILLADKRQIVWYRNPGPAQSRDPAAWHKYVIAENLTEDDNVCIAAQDIDGDGKCEVAVGAAWKPSDTEKSGAVFYLIPPADRTQPWTPVKFPSVEPTTHRMRWVKLEDGTWGLVVLPLHGRGNKNGEGDPVKVILYRPPTPLNDPAGQWKPVVISSQSLHMTHNLEVMDTSFWYRHRRVPSDQPGSLIMVAAKEGIVSMGVDLAHGGQIMGWRESSWAAGLSINGKPVEPTLGFRGAGEVRVGTLPDGSVFNATVEPMHGTDLAVYSGNGNNRNLLTDHLAEGHALACGHLLGQSQGDEIVVGWRGKSAEPESSIGVAVWTPLDNAGEKWRETVIDENGMACEDLKLADLDGNGRLDIIAAGRRTHNVKIYFNDIGSSKP